MNWREVLSSFQEVLPHKSDTALERGRKLIEMTSFHFAEGDVDCLVYQALADLFVYCEERGIDFQKLIKEVIEDDESLSVRSRQG